LFFTKWRDAGIPIAHFSGLKEEEFSVFLVCDRYSAYKKRADKIPPIVLPFCWAHVRRDFLDAARRWPHLQEWRFTWVDDISKLDSINNRRMAHGDEAQALNKPSESVEPYQAMLRQTLSDREMRRDTCLAQQERHDVQRAVLTRLKNHGSGLRLCFEQPQIKRDNPTAERCIRNPITGRKRDSGSGRVWGAELAASLLKCLCGKWRASPHSFIAFFTVGNDKRATTNTFAPIKTIDETPSVQDSG